MKTHDNTLYVTTQGAYIARRNETLLIRVEKETRFQCPAHNLHGVICFGNVSLSPFAMGLCGENGVAISFLTENGRFLGRFVGPTSGNVLLRRAQYRAADDVDGLAHKIASTMIAAKIANARTSLLRSAREKPQAESDAPLRRAIDRLADDLRHIDKATTLDTLRGAEGDAADDYFRAFNYLLTSQQQAFEFNGRSRRPPADNVNALLSYLYTLLAHDVRAACESVGLDPQVGFLHRDRPGRPSLALDLMEEFRPVLADRMAVTLINRQQVTPDGFTKTEAGGVEMNDKTRKTVITAWQKRKAETITHPFLQEKITIGLLPHIQARLLARHLRGDLDQYPPFFWR